jgi:uncharacterized repeat protein (TIGR03803 family)
MQLMSRPEYNGAVFESGNSGSHSRPKAAKRRGGNVSKFNCWMRACVLFLLWAATAVALPAQTFKSLYSFDSTDGANPYAGLVQGTDGNFYGTTYVGGHNNYGTVFKITPSGKLTTLYSFCSKSSCADGARPYAGLVQGTNGDFYGTTGEGGGVGSGTVFKITPSGKLTTLHSFDGKDGSGPYAALVQGANGDFYGTTLQGGAGTACTANCGTVFEISPSGKPKTLYNFCFKSDCTDGYYPSGALVQGANGDFYGTTREGGAHNLGTVFKITPSGKLTTLWSFDGTDGANPYGGLVQATDGDFYGTTGGGGAIKGVSYGTVFKITPSGKLTTLHSFDATDGYYPYGGLVQATDGNFYGTTRLLAGPYNDGTIFKITPSGKLTTLWSFDGTDGDQPYAGLVQDTNGSFYGTTVLGGANGDGTVFSLSVGLGPFVETQPTSGTVGAAVKILGTDLTGATSVTFNGTPAVFKVVSASLITTTVPTDATTGTVDVTTPKGTLKSNVVFRVTK